MLIPQLTDIAAELELAFYFGGQPGFNVIVNDHTDEMGMALFHETYMNEGWTPDAQGELDETNNVILWLLTPSELSDEPDTRLPYIHDTKRMMKQVVKKLMAYYELKAINVQGVKNHTRRNFDGVRLTCTAKALIPETDDEC